ncbi:MAG TPA: hypothetical protein VIY29_26855, partial [Ktedonobacteraceae bacterium]
ASEEARKSPYVKDELRLAHDVHHLPIYPLWVAGAQWINCIPLGWGGTQYIDARGGEAQYQAALRQLIAALSGANPVASLIPDSTYSNQFPNFTPTPVGVSFPEPTQPTRSGRGNATFLFAALVTLRIAVLATLVLGITLWTGNFDYLKPIHMLLGILVVLSLWAVGLAQGFMKGGSFVMAAATFILGLIIAIFGLYQVNWLTGSAHWVIQDIHLLLGLSAIALGEVIYGRTRRRLKAAAAA